MRKTSLQKGDNTYYGERFELYCVLSSECADNVQLKRAAENAGKVGDIQNMYILRDKSQRHNCEYFIMHPYENVFRQMYKHGPGHGTYSGGVCEEARMTLGLPVKPKYDPYETYDDVDVYMKGEKICVCWESGSFSTGYMDHTISIEDWLSHNGFEFEMLDGNRNLSRVCVDTSSDSYIICLYDDINWKHSLYVMPRDGSAVCECKILDLETYRDGGTTNITYMNNGAKYELHLDTPFHDPQVHTINNIKNVIKSIDKDETGSLYRRFAEASGIYLTKCR